VKTLLRTGAPDERSRCHSRQRAREWIGHENQQPEVRPRRAPCTPSAAETT